VVYRLRDNEQRIRGSAGFEGPSAEKHPGAGKKTSKSKPPAKAESTHGAEERRLVVELPPTGHNTSSVDAGLWLPPTDNTSIMRDASSFDQDYYNDWKRGVNIRWGQSNERRLGATVKEPLKTSGEAQYRDAYEEFMIDVGFSRDIIMNVQCADATQANIGAYKLTINRPGCSPKQPYFDPLKKQCVNFCPAGYYRNEETNRCSKCNTNCKVCNSLLHCQMCKDDTADFTYMVQPDGRCSATVNHLFKKYRWWCVGLAVLLGFLVLIGCIGICQCVGNMGHGIDKRQRKVHTYDSEEEVDGPPYGARRRLAEY